jgi:homoserine kinase
MTIIDKQGIPRFKQLLLQAGLSDPLLEIEPDTEGVQVVD